MTVSNAARRQGHQPRPELDAKLLSDSLRGVQLRKLELVHLRFSRTDDGPLPPGVPVEGSPEVMIDVDWEVTNDRTTLGCLVRLAAVFPVEGEEEDTGDAAPYAVQCEYRVLYLVTNEKMKDASFKQIAYWDATAVVWPYFRADLSALLAQADLPQVLLPTLQARV